MEEEAKWKNSWIQLAGTSCSEKITSKVVVEEVKEYKLTWVRQMSQTSLEDQLKIETEAANWLEAKEAGMESKFQRKERQTKGKKLKLGDSLKLHDPAEWLWDTCESDWDGTQDKAARNKEWIPATKFL